MTNDKKITFQIGETKIIINDKKDKVKIKNEDNNFNRDLKSVFEDLAQADQLEKLETIFSKIGNNNDNRNLDDADIAFLEQFSEAGKSSQEYMIKIIDEKLKEIDNLQKEATTTILADSSAEAVIPFTASEVKTSSDSENKSNEVNKKTEAGKNTKASEKSEAIKEGNEAIAKRVSETCEEGNDAVVENTVDVKKGDNLWKIAKKILKEENSGQTPSNKMIMEKCVEIACLNGMTGDNEFIIYPGQKLKVKSNSSTTASEQHPADPDPSSTTVAEQHPAVEPLVAEYTPILLQGDLKDPDTDEWVSDDAYELQNFDLKEGSLTRYLKTTTTCEGENATSTTEEKFVYEKDGVKFEANTEDDIKVKIETFNNALEELTKTVENEESATKTARIDKAYTDIINLGSKSAVKFAHKKMMEGNTDESAELYLNLTKDLLYKGDPELFAENVLPSGTEGDLSKLVNGDEKVQKVVGEYIKHLEEKYNNSTITPNELTMLEKLRPVANHTDNTEALKGISISADTGQYAMDLWTDIHGNSYWQSESEANYKALDKDVLNSFLTMKADADTTKDVLFETFTTEGADPELVKSLAKQAKELNISADKILALVAHADLDVLYALDYSHLPDETSEAQEGQDAQKSPKAQVAEAILARKNELLNLNPIEKMQGLDISNKTPGDTENTDITSLKEDPTNPEIKAKVHNILLTRDAEIVKKLITKDDGNGKKVLDNTLFENDPVALKTLAALLKELRDKEKAGERLNADEIALKEAIKANGTYGFYAKMQDGKLLSFNGDGDLVVLKDDTAKSIATNSEMLDRPVDLTDPVILADKVLLKYILQNDNDALAKLNKDQLLDLISNQLDSAYLLGTFNFAKINESIKNDTDALKEVQDAYINKAKDLFAFEEVGGQELDPTGAVSLRFVLDTIAGFNGEVDDVNNEILSQFFKTETTTDENDNSVETVKLKNFRRFTYEEMSSLALYVYYYGTREQYLTIRSLVDLENIEHGQFGDAIEQYTDDEVDNLFNEDMSKIEVLKYIDNINYSGADIPFKNIIDKFKDDPDVMTKLLVRYNGTSIEQEYKDKLLNYLIDSNGNVKIPDGADITGLAYLLPDEKAQDGEKPAITMNENQKKVFEALVNATDDFEALAELVGKASQTIELREEAENRIIYLLDPLTVDNLNKAISAFRTLPVTLATQMIIFLNITEISEDISECKATVFEAALKNNQNCAELFNKAINNGWLSSETLKSGEEIDNTWYSFGNAEMVASYSVEEDKVVIKQKAEILNGLATQDGEEKANNIYELVKGLNSKDNTDTLKTNLNDTNYITKDNVVALLNQWQEKSPNEGIIEYMNREWNGPTIAEMEVIPLKLIEVAKAKGLNESEDPLKSLINMVNDQPFGNKNEKDYNAGYARSIDDLMKQVLDKLKAQNSDT